MSGVSLSQGLGLEAIFAVIFDPIHEDGANNTLLLHSFSGMQVPGSGVKCPRWDLCELLGE